VDLRLRISWGTRLQKYFASSFLAPGVPLHSGQTWWLNVGGLSSFSLLHRISFTRIFSDNFFILDFSIFPHFFIPSFLRTTTHKHLFLSLQHRNRYILSFSGSSTAICVFLLVRFFNYFTFSSKFHSHHRVKSTHVKLSSFHSYPSYFQLQIGFTGFNNFEARKTKKQKTKKKKKKRYTITSL